jgi:malate dehydrogenase (oxaloacetate-decarboxylating)(NADP+)
MDLLLDPRVNKGTAFSQLERELLGVRGLLPARVFSEDAQVERNISNLRRKESDFERYLALSALAERNQTLFYRVLLDHVAELMPVVYTPTVGEACQRYGYIYQRPRGLFVSAVDRGQIAAVLRTWPERDIRVIVVTDGSRILGLGDLGAHGMGIPVGKLILYTVCAGVHPEQCLPITLDVGTDNEELREDPVYIGLQQPRMHGREYDDFLAEFVAAVREVFPQALLQFEDFSNQTAFRLLAHYRDELRCFNDDIQGTAAVALAGIFSALRITQRPLQDQRLLFLGAGEAGIGIADLFVKAVTDAGIALEVARAQCWFFDSRGLVIQSRADLNENKRRYAQPHPPTTDLLTAVKQLRPTALIGVSGQPQTITQPMVEAMCMAHERPIVFALSNPTSKAECTAAQAYEWSQGRAIFASGSPFPACTFEGRELVPGQGNNAYIFPGVGLGVVASGASRVVDEMFAVAARTLALQVRQEDLDRGSIYPPLTAIRDVSAHIAAAVAEVAFARGLATVPRPKDLLAWIRSQVYVPSYPSYA